MRTISFSLLLLTAASLFTAPAHAEKADRNKPMNIEADALRHDDLKQLSVFTGKVVMTKGSMVLRGERLDVRQDPDGYQSGVIQAAAGQRAFFRQKRDTPAGAPEEYLEGEAETITYDGRNDTVRLSRRAELRRYRSATLNDQISGEAIVYDNITDVFTVDGKPNNAAGGKPAAGGGGRVRATLTPKPEAQQPAPASKGGGATLRPSLGLEGEKK